MTLQQFKNTINRVNRFNNYIDKLSEFGIELIDTPLSDNFYLMFEDLIRLSYGEVGLDYVLWWLYESVEDKRIFDENDKEIANLETIEDLYNYLETL
jgi:hypothetical protein